MKILLGTKNRAKIKEILAIFSELSVVEWLTFANAPFDDVEEDGSSFIENARKKALQISRQTGLTTLAEDSGLEVAALNGAPGHLSARFAGPHATDAQNIEKLLRLLNKCESRAAQFRCTAVLAAPDGREWHSEGILRGEIAYEPKGEFGFGYDPVFAPDGYSESLGQLGDETKNLISHRRRALEAMREVIVELAANANEG